MSYPIEQKLVIAVSSSALFDLTDSDAVFKEHGEAAYRKYQMDNLDNTLKKGAAFSFVRRFLRLNEAFPAEMPVEVVLLSRNNAETGLRVFRSIENYGLDISRAAFLTGRSPHNYIRSFNASLFLSSNIDDVENAIKAGYPAGNILSSNIGDDESDLELRLAMDFDGIIADDESESVYANSDLETFVEHEKKHVNRPHEPGPLGDFFKKLAYIQKLEQNLVEKEPTYKTILRTAIITARSAPAHERVITTLMSWGISPDETFFMGGIKKQYVLKELKPHMFFDDQRRHLEDVVTDVSMVHIPFGISNGK